jgi:YegS/Rv2252/BmrU family lipid kinase
MAARKAYFILNPNAGKRKAVSLLDQISSASLLHHKVTVSTSLEYFEEIKSEILADNYTDVIACGGDGTVNKVAAFAHANKLRFGILPLGSGNGLARTMGISMNLVRAIEQIEQGQSKKIDVGLLNGKTFFCAAGIGFDAHIAALFEKTHSRGLGGYIRLISREFFSYKKEKYSLLIDGKEINKEAFVVACCNSGQYGNDFYIAPTASITDGKITVSMITSFYWLQVPYILLRVIMRSADKLSSVETYHGQNIKIRREKKGFVHIDGEPYETGEEINLAIDPLSLEIIC